MRADANRAESPVGKRDANERKAARPAQIELPAATRGALWRDSLSSSAPNCSSQNANSALKLVAPSPPILSNTVF